MLKKAKNVEAVVVYNDAPNSRSQLARLGLQLMTRKELRRANAEMICQQPEADSACSTLTSPPCFVPIC
jgi:hypothetical protein